MINLKTHVIHLFLFSALLCELLKIVLYLVAGLKVELVYLIKPLIGLIDFSLFTQILVILGIFV